MKLPVVIFIQQKQNLRLLMKLASGYNMQESDECVCEFCKESNQEQQKKTKKNAAIEKENIFFLMCEHVCLLVLLKDIQGWKYDDKISAERPSLPWPYVHTSSQLIQLQPSGFHVNAITPEKAWQPNPAGAEFEIV